MATHSSTLAWKISWTREPSRLQSMGSQWAISLSLFHFPSWEPVRCHILSSRGRAASVLSSHTFGVKRRPQLRFVPRSCFFRLIFCPFPVDLGSSPKFSYLAGTLVPRWIWPTSPCGFPGPFLVSELWRCQLIMKGTLAAWSHPCLTQAPVLIWLKNSRLSLLWPTIFQYSCYLFNQGCTKVFLAITFLNILALPLP